MRLILLSLLAGVALSRPLNGGEHCSFDSLRSRDRKES
jgi:hypothetical protein